MATQDRILVPTPAAPTVIATAQTRYGDPTRIVYVPAKPETLHEDGTRLTAREPAALVFEIAYANALGERAFSAIGDQHEDTDFRHALIMALWQRAQAAPPQHEDPERRELDGTLRPLPERLAAASAARATLTHTPYTVGDARHVALWDAINAVVAASGGRVSTVSDARIRAVALVERALEAIVRAEPAYPSADYVRSELIIAAFAMAAQIEERTEKDWTTAERLLDGHARAYRTVSRGVVHAGAAHVIGEAPEPGRPHIVNGEFQSDKYPTTPRGKVPLSVKDPTAQDLLWEYAQRRRTVDAEFSADLEYALERAGHERPKSMYVNGEPGDGIEACSRIGFVTMTMLGVAQELNTSTQERYIKLLKQGAGELEICRQYIRKGLQEVTDFVDGLAEDIVNAAAVLPKRDPATYAPDLDLARAGVDEIGKALDSMAFAPPEGQLLHAKRACDGIQTIANAIGAVPPAEAAPEVQAVLAAAEAFANVRADDGSDYKAAIGHRVRDLYAAVKAYREVKSL